MTHGNILLRNFLESFKTYCPFLLFIYGFNSKHFLSLVRYDVDVFSDLEDFLQEIIANTVVDVQVAVPCRDPEHLALAIMVAVVVITTAAAHTQTGGVPTKVQQDTLHSSLEVQRNLACQGLTVFAFSNR